MSVLKNNKLINDNHQSTNASACVEGNNMFHTITEGFQHKRTRKNDQKHKSKIDNIQNKTGIMNYLSLKNTNYKINLCKNIRMNFHFNILL